MSRGFRRRSLPVRRGNESLSYSLVEVPVWRLILGIGNEPNLTAIYGSVVCFALVCGFDCGLHRNAPGENEFGMGEKWG